jgi:membrane-associated phospholipid phosphatase
MQARAADHRMLEHHRTAFLWSAILLVLCVCSLFLVGRHPPELAPQTTAAIVGRFDESMHSWMDDIQNTPLTWLAKALNVLGGGFVTIPVRIAATAFLLWRRRWRQAVAFVLTWITSEVVLTWLKIWFHRGRPPGALVVTSGNSFPSGHAVAASATAVALVLAFFPPGERRRRWEWLAVAFAFVMAFSRVYLSAHWFSDVVAGTLLGAGIAIFWASAVTEVRDVWFRREGRPIPSDRAEPQPEELLHETPG